MGEAMKTLVQRHQLSPLRSGLRQFSVFSTVVMPRVSSKSGRTALKPARIAIFINGKRVEPAVA